jgi:hypothetical protein
MRVGAVMSEEFVLRATVLVLRGLAHQGVA